MRLGLAASLLIGWLNCGGTSDRDICDDGTQATCAKFAECNIQNEDECLAELSGECATNNGCPTDEIFDRDAAEACIDQIMAATCTEVADMTADLSACDMVCTSP